MYIPTKRDPFAPKAPQAPSKWFSPWGLTDHTYHLTHPCVRLHFNGSTHGLRFYLIHLGYGLVMVRAATRGYCAGHPVYAEAFPEQDWMQGVKVATQVALHKALDEQPTGVGFWQNDFQNYASSYRRYLVGLGKQAEALGVQPERSLLVEAQRLAALHKRGVAWEA